MIKSLLKCSALSLSVLAAASSAQAGSVEWLSLNQNGEEQSLFVNTVEEPYLEAIVETPTTQTNSEDQFVQTTYSEQLTPVTCGYNSPCAGSDCTGRMSWLENTEVWVGADAFRSFGDGRFALFNPLPFATANSFGTVAGFNTTYGWDSTRIRAQVGASYGAYDWKGRTIDNPPEAGTLQQQGFLTYGLYKRSDVCCGDRVSWGIVSDHFYGDEYGWTADEIVLHQFRWQLGYALNCHNEVGMNGTFRTANDTVGISSVGATINTQVHAMNQWNAYFKHQWEFGGNSSLYIGTFDGADIASWQFGMLNTSPLNDYLSLYGNFGYVAPGSSGGLTGSAEEQWNVSVGLIYSFGGKASSPNISGHQGLALMPVANNNNFLITN